MQKCGLVMKDVNTHKWKVKLYMDKENNHFKGDALCTYIKVSSSIFVMKKYTLLSLCFVYKFINNCLVLADIYLIFNYRKNLLI